MSSKKKSYRDLQRELEAILQRQKVLKEEKASTLVNAIVGVDAAGELIADMSDADLRGFGKYLAYTLEDSLHGYESYKAAKARAEQEPAQPPVQEPYMPAYEGGIIQ